jgi:N-acetyl-beta-hexosaminidase
MGQWYENLEAESTITEIAYPRTPTILRRALGNASREDGQSVLKEVQRRVHRTDKKDKEGGPSWL